MSILSPGVPTFDGNFACYCFRCDEVTLRDTVRKLLGFRVLTPLADGRTPVTTNTAIRVLRYAQCDWSLLVPITLPEGMNYLEAHGILETISGLLATDALFLGIFDTASAAQYRYFQAGELREALTFEMGESTFHSKVASPRQREYNLDDIDRRVQELGIIPALYWSPIDLKDNLALSLAEIDVNWHQVAQSFVMES